MFAKFNGKHLRQRLCFNKVAGLKAAKQRMAQVFSCEFIEISKNTFITEDFRTTVSAFSFSEKLGKNVFLKILQSSQENTCDLRNFPGTPFLWNTSERLLLAFPFDFTKTLPTVFGKPLYLYSLWILVVNTVYLETPALVRFCISFLFQQHKISVYVSLVYTVYCQKQPPHQRCSVKKGILKHFVNS